jgi:hypothetical protein
MYCSTALEQQIGQALTTSKALEQGAGIMCRSGSIWDAEAAAAAAHIGAQNNSRV